jgi:hypothetical protein
MMTANKLLVRIDFLWGGLGLVYRSTPTNNKKVIVVLVVNENIMMIEILKNWELLIDGDLTRRLYLKR